MMYFDAAYIAKCYLNEPGADRVRAAANRADGLVSCELARVEFACIVLRHVREGHLKPAEPGLSSGTSLPTKPPLCGTGFPSRRN